MRIKGVTGFSLFWKIYLTLLLVLFLPVILFTLSRMIRDQDRDMPKGILRHLEWSASKLAEQADLMPRELLASWLESEHDASGLAIRVRRDGEDFCLPDAEWFVLHEPDAADTNPFPPKPGPIVVSSASRSGRTKVIAGLYPFREEEDGARSGPRRRNIEVLLLVAVLCVALSFMLVRNFMTPLSELRRITLKLANGDLSARAGPGVTGRSDEIADLGRRFNNMAERVETLVSSQKRLLSDISHEIRSPLQRMEVASALLRDKSCADPRKYLDRIELEISRIDDMVEELLTLTRTDEAHLARSETVKLDEVINSIIGDVEFENGVREEKKGTEKKEKIIVANLQKVSVVGDATLLDRALGNVIHNAIRCTAPGTGVEINARQDGACVAVTVRDHGQGVPEKDLEKIFLPYYRTDEARERSRGGVGLGLAITKRIIENHGGTIAASNAPAGGLLVTIRFTHP
ncbi:MAG: HAMP domain-containing protein [Synergistaceae bacterium]|jgi:two-component system sensor histidine kinase CpxA|nr:HAMP domain-containing protein [Synergistaceae bacterium]